VGLTPFSSWNKDGKQFNFLKEKNTMLWVYFNWEKRVEVVELASRQPKVGKKAERLKELK
jgi:hypothetical protein